jgi:8-oxo-dGTP pyrophosphatase MutT (NUDIX family)
MSRKNLPIPHFVLHHDDEGANSAVMAAIAAMAPSRMAAVLVPIIARAEPTVLFTQRTAHLADYAGQIAFPGGKIEPVDAGPAAAALREARKRSRSTAASLSRSAI